MPTQDTVELAKEHLRMLPPHVQQRKSATLLRECVAEIERLRIVLRTARSLGTLFEVQMFIDAELDED